jgi:hypothetical protein
MTAATAIAHPNITFIKFLIDIKEGVSLFGNGGFSYETENLLGVLMDLVPLSILPQVCDREFGKNIHEDAIAL